MEAWRYNIFSIPSCEKFVIIKYQANHGKNSYVVEVYDEFFAFDEDLRFIYKNYEGLYTNVTSNRGAIVHAFVIDAYLVKNLGYRVFGIPNEGPLVSIEKTGLFDSKPVHYLKDAVDMNAINKSFKKRTKRFIEQVSKCDEYILRFNTDEYIEDLEP
jgi:hypothetical protein